MRDLNNIPAINGAGEQKFTDAKNAIKSKSDKIKEEYILKEIEKKVKQGIKEDTAKKMILQRIENRKITHEDTFFDNDNVEIKVYEILAKLEKYDKKYIRDLVEPEKGQSKAIINCTMKTNPSIHSFLHGGITYSIVITLDFILKYIEQNISPQDTDEDKKSIEKVKYFCQLANLSTSEVKKVAWKLKAKGILDSIPEFQIVEESAMHFPFKNKNGSPKSVRENLEVLLKYFNLKVKYDEILKTVQIESDEDIKETDNKINSFFSEIVNLCVKNGLNTSVVKNYLWTIIDQNSFNPMIEMIHSKKWDGEDRLTHLINSIFSPDKEEYKIEIITRWLIQCTAAWDRAIKSPYPNVLPRFENVLTFVGSQGINKTKFFELLLPREYKQYVGTGNHLDPTNKDSIHLAIGKAITELGELDSTFKGDIAKIKAFLSLSVDKYRIPYAQNESEFARRTSFCASVNDIEFLVDPTGNRRFWPLNIYKIDFATYQELDKQQLWAQVYETLYLQGEHWWIDTEHNPEVSKMLSEKHQEHAVLNPADEIALSVIEYTKKAKENDLYWKNATEIALANNLSGNGRNNISIIKKRLMDAGIEFNSKNKKFKVCLYDKQEVSVENKYNKYR